MGQKVNTFTVIKQVIWVKFSFQNDTWLCKNSDQLTSASRVLVFSRKLTMNEL